MDIKVEFRDPRISLEEKLKLQRDTKLKRFTISLFIFALVIISSVLLVELGTYEKVTVSQEYLKEVKGNSSYTQFSEGILRTSRDGVSFTDKKGNETWNKPYQFKTPVTVTNYRSGAVADKGGNDIVVFNDETILGEIHTTNPIEKIAVSGNGIVGVLMKNESAPFVMVYDAAGELLVEHQSTISGKGYPISMTLSPKGKQMIVTYMCVVDGIQSTRVVYYDFSGVGKEENGYQVKEDVYKNQVIPIGIYLDEKRSVLVSDNSLIFYNGGSHPEVEKKIKIDKNIRSFFYDEHYLGFMLQNQGKEGRELRVYNTKGKEVLSKNIDGEFTNIKIANGDVIMYHGKTCSIYSILGIHRFVGEMDQEILEMIPLQGMNRYLMVNEDGLREIRLTK